MPQRFGLYEDLSVIENLNLYAELRGLAAAERVERFDRLLAFTDLKRFAGAPGRQAVGRHEAEARARLRAGAPAPAAAARRARRRRRSGVAARAVGDGPGTDRAGRRRAVVDGLSRRGRTLRRRLPAARGQAPACRPARANSRSACRAACSACRSRRRRRRALLREALDNPAVLDGVIQGDSLRLLLRDGAAGPAAIGAVRGAGRSRCGRASRMRSSTCSAAARAATSALAASLRPRSGQRRRR